MKRSKWMAWAVAGAIAAGGCVAETAEPDVSESNVTEQGRSTLAGRTFSLAYRSFNLWKAVPQVWGSSQIVAPEHAPAQYEELITEGIELLVLIDGNVVGQAADERVELCAESSAPAPLYDDEPAVPTFRVMVFYGPKGSRNIDEYTRLQDTETQAVYPDGVRASLMFFDAVEMTPQGARARYSHSLVANGAPVTVHIPFEDNPLTEADETVERDLLFFAVPWDADGPLVGDSPKGRQFAFRVPATCGF